MEQPKVEINIHNLVETVNVSDQGMSTEELQRKLEKALVAALNMSGQYAWEVVPMRTKEEIRKDLDRISDELDGIITEAKKIDMELQIELPPSHWAQYRKIELILIERKYKAGSSEAKRS